MATLTIGALLAEAKVDKVSAAELLSCSKEEIEALAKLLGLKPGHRARFVRTCRRKQKVAASETKELEQLTKKNEMILVDSILPFANFLSSLDSKDKPSFVEFMEKAGDVGINLRKVFLKADKNEDLILDKKEFAQGVEGILLSSKEWLVPYLEWMSKNAPAYVTPSERIWLADVISYLKKHFSSKLYPTVKKSIKTTDYEDWFVQVDTNKDGKVDAREFSRGVVLLLFQAIDELVLKAADSAITEKKFRYSKVKMSRKKKKYRGLVRQPSFQRVQKPQIRDIQILRPTHTQKAPVKSGSGGEILAEPRDFPYPIRTAAALPDMVYYGREYGTKVDGKLIPLQADTVTVQKGEATEDWSAMPSMSSPYASYGAHIEGKLKISNSTTKPNLSESTLIRLRNGWLSQAKGEHASVASFANHTLELMKFGAPASLIQGALIAAQDEVRHAQSCFSLASRFDPDGVRYGPAKFPLKGSADVAQTLSDMVGKLAGEGCYGETMGSVYAAKQLLECKDPKIKAELEKIIVEEANHAVLAWDTVKWAISVGGPKILRVVQGRLEGLMARAKLAEMKKGKVDAEEEELAVYGILSGDVLKNVEANQGRSMVLKLLASLRSHSQAFIAEGKGTLPSNEKWDPKGIIAKVVNEIVKRDILV